MFQENQKKLIPYELYIAKKLKKGDPLTAIMNKKHKESVHTDDSIDTQLKQMIKNNLNNKRIEQLKKQYGKAPKITNPQCYIKRTWQSPYLSKKYTNEKATHIHLLQSNFSKFRNQRQLKNNQKQQLNNITHHLYMNSKLHYFGDFMCCDFDQNRNQNKQNIQSKVIPKNKSNALQQLYKEFLKLQQTDNKLILCSNNVKKTKFYNPLKEDKYYKQIMKKDDLQLMKLLIQILSPSNYFNFSSFINFYEIFVWQQSSKNIQLDFVLRLLMKSYQKITYRKLSQSIDFFCSKIKLPGKSEGLDGFNQVMKKLIFGDNYQNSQKDILMSRQTLKQNLEANEECISIFINVFYCQ